MRDIPFSDEEKRDYMAQLLLALAYMEKVGVMHRDIKPDNIMIKNKNSEEIVLTDFGLATFQMEKFYLYPKCGTPGYVAPEIINKK
jgi:calcium-dependent protein kinase